MAERTLTKAVNDPKTKICWACCKIIDHPVSLFDPVGKTDNTSFFLWRLPSKFHAAVYLRKMLLLYLISLMQIALIHGNDSYFCFWPHAPPPRIWVSGKWIIPELHFLALATRNAGSGNKIGTRLHVCGTCAKWLQFRLLLEQQVGIQMRVKHVQKTPLVGTAMVLRFVLSSQISRFMSCLVAGWCLHSL